jgi:hypothetical protein
MHFNKFLEKLIVLCLFIATVGTTYVFIVTMIFGDTSFTGFYSSWQMPMLFALFIDAAYYKHISRVGSVLSSQDMRCPK